MEPFACPPGVATRTLVACVCLAGCEPTDTGGGGEATEIISAVELTFSPEGGGENVRAAFRDPDGDGGMSGVAEPLTLSAGITYTLEVVLRNALVEPAIDLTQEIAEEAEEHQLFALGSGVQGPASDAASALVTHAYADRESDYGANANGEDLELGLRNTVTAVTAGSGELRVVLRHLPPLNDTPLKVPGLAQSLRNGDALAGDVDVDVTFSLEVQ